MFDGLDHFVYYIYFLSRGNVVKEFHLIFLKLKLFKVHKKAIGSKLI